MRTSQATGGRAASAGHRRAPGSSEFLTFTLGGEEYGVDIGKVREIRRYESVKRIANAPEHIKGVIRLRATMVPIVDLRIKFDLGPALYTPCTAVIVLNVAGRIVGAVVDSVSDVTTLLPGQIRPAPERHAATDTGFLMGLGALDGRMLILLDVERLVTGDELALIESSVH